MVTNNLLIENARIAMRNFSGRPGKYNAAGVRSFGVILDYDQGVRLQSEGWKVRWLHNDDVDQDTPFIPVAVSFSNYPPTIVQITSRGKTYLEEDMVGILDRAEIRQCDILLRPYNWEVRGETGVKAYLKSMYVTIEEDELAAKYADQEEVPF